MTAPHTAPSDLITFALDALAGMQLGDGSFCLEVRQGVRRPQGRSDRYTVMTALGLARAAEAGHEHDYDVERIATLVLDRDGSARRPGDLGLALWLDARLGGSRVPRIVKQIGDALARTDGLAGCDGQELGWLITGGAEAVAAGHNEAEPVIDQARRQLLGRDLAASGLADHRGVGGRRRFPNFATEIYSVLGLATAAKLLGDARSADAARGIADRLIELQRPNGGWPWMYDAERATVVEPYRSTWFTRTRWRRWR